MINKEYDFSKYKNTDYIEFYSVSDVYDKGDNDEYHLVKRAVKTKEKVWKYDIAYVREVFNSKGNVRRQRTEIGVRNRDPIVVLGRYRDIDPIVFNTNNTINKSVGFKFY